MLKAFQNLSAAFREAQGLSRAVLARPAIAGFRARTCAREPLRLPQKAE